MTTIQYTYTGSVIQETRKFNFARGSILVNLFAAGKWKHIIQNNGNRVDVNKSGSDISRSITDDDVEITINDTVQNFTTVLRGKLYKSQRGPNNGLVIVIMSGSGGPAIEYTPDIVKGYLAIPSLNPYVKACLVVDYRGFGLSRHDRYVRSENYKPTPAYMPGTRALYTDARAMVEFCTNHLGVPADRIILHGYSLGSGPAVETSKIVGGIGGLVLHGPMKSVNYESFRSIAPSKKVAAIGTGSIIGAPLIGAWIGVAALGGAISHGNAGFQNINKVGSLKLPVLVTSGPNDTMWSGAKSLYNKLRKRRNFRTYMGVHTAEHLETSGPFQNTAAPKQNQPARTALRNFLQHVMNQAGNWGGRNW